MATPTNLAQYYTGKGQTLPSVQDRSKLFETAGLGKSTEYQGTISQNNSLLSHLLSTDAAAAEPAGSTAPDSAVVTAPQPTPAPAPGAPAASGAPTSGTGYSKEVTPPGGEPAAPHYADTYAALRASQGIDTIEDNINHLQDQATALQEQLPAFRAADASGGVGTVFNARETEEQRNIQEQLDIVNRQISLAQNNLTIKNDYINSMMSFTEKDYTAAKDQYETDFTHNLSIQSAVDSQADRVQTAARANITTMFNILSNSGKTLDDMPSSFSNQLASLEMQAGFPPGFFETFAKTKPKANIIGAFKGTDPATGNDQYVVISQNPDTGMPTTSVMSTPVSSGGTKNIVTSGSLSISRSDIGSASSALLAIPQGDDRLTAYDNAYQAWTSPEKGGKPQDFFTQFPPKNYLDFVSSPSPYTKTIPNYIENAIPTTEQGTQPSTPSGWSWLWGGQ